MYIKVKIKYRMYRKTQKRLVKSRLLRVLTRQKIYSNKTDSPKTKDRLLTKARQTFYHNKTENPPLGQITYLSCCEFKKGL